LDGVNSSALPNMGMK